MGSPVASGLGNVERLQPVNDVDAFPLGLPFPPHNARCRSDASFVPPLVSVSVAKILRKRPRKMPGRSGEKRSNELTNMQNRRLVKTTPFRMKHFIVRKTMLNLGGVESVSGETDIGGDTQLKKCIANAGGYEF